MLCLGDGSVVFVGTTQSPFPRESWVLLVGLDASGAVLFERNFHSILGSSEGHAIVQTPGGGFAIASDAPGEVVHPYLEIQEWPHIFQTDGKGQVLWERRVGDFSDYGALTEEGLAGRGFGISMSAHATDIALAADGGFLTSVSTLSGSMLPAYEGYVAKLDADGQLQWESENFRANAPALLVTAGDETVVLLYDFWGAETGVAKIDGAGALLWRRSWLSYEGPGRYFSGLTAGPFSTLAIAGWISFPDDPSRLTEIYLLQTDAQAVFPAN